jgi:exonuclease III
MGKNVKNMSLRFKHVTLNVRGLRNTEKRRRIFHWLKDKHIDIVFLQETFFTEELLSDVNKDWDGSIEHAASDSPHSRGVSVLFNPNLDVKIENVHRSKDARKILLNVEVNGDKFTLVNIYAPNKQNLLIDFYKRATSWIPQYSDEDNLIIISGDMNCNENNIVVWRAYHKFKEKLKLLDVWDHVNFNQNCNTWIDPADPTHQSRLDYVLTSQYLVESVKTCKISHAPTPDHKAVTTEFVIKKNIRGPSYWKLNNSILAEEKYKILIQIIITKAKEEFHNFSYRLLWDMIKIRIKETTIKYCILRHRQSINFIILNV